MLECLPVKCSAQTIRRPLRYASASWRLLIAFIALISAPPAALAQRLPPGGTTSWEIQKPEEIVTFVLFDPKSRGVSLPTGLRFVSARDAKLPEIQEYVKQHPEPAEWAFSFIEITRQKAFLLDGRAPALPRTGYRIMVRSS